MKLIALALGLILEHVATQLLHLRELRWFDRYYDFGIARLKKLDRWLIHLGVAVILLVLASPVFLVSYALQGPGVLWDPDYLVFAVLVVFLCLGPRDLGSEVDEYCAALDRNDTETAARVLVEMSESENPRIGDIDVVEEAVFVQSVNRIFGVVFWFVVLGPVGAWLFRISDLLRRRAAFEAARDMHLKTAILPAIEAIYGTLKWIPARLAMLGFALSGSFDDAMNKWRSHRTESGAAIDTRNDALTARVGKAAMTGFLDQPPNSSAAARNALKLVTRTLFIWITLLALMTIVGWAV
ncbi:MAG TPA: regulatory signaling modulator protein AmpE [Gammaproteobacteria bacterium]